MKSHPPTFERRGVFLHHRLPNAACHPAGKLKTVMFQAQLGSLFDKSERLALLAGRMADQLGWDVSLAQRAGELSKADLVSKMVYEFAEMQGIAGYYYARNDGEPQEVAEALKEQYLPRFAGDALPESHTGCLLALADRLDTLVGIFGIGQIPTGSKDPSPCAAPR